MNQDQRLGKFFDLNGTPIPETKKVTTNEKGWSQDWLKMKEANLLAQGTSLADPYSQSYIVYRAIRSIAENVPQAQYKIFDGERVLPPTDPVSQIFLNPNPFMSRFEFWEALTTYLNYRGETFIYMNKSVGNLTGRRTLPAELWVLDPTLVKHSFDKGELAGWTYNNQLVMEPDELIHFKLFNPNAHQFRGLSPIASARNEIDADYSASRWNKVFFDNNATPDSVIQVDKDKEIDIKDLRKLKKMWYEKHGGTENAHKTAFLLGGMTFKHMSLSQKDMDYIIGRQFSRDATLSVFGVHPFVAGFYDSGTVTRATAKEAKRLFWTGTLIPQLIRIEEKLAVKFFPKYAPGLVGKFDLSQVEELQDDFNESVTSGKELFSLGYTRNEINTRLQLGMPKDDTDGDVRYLPINMVEVGEDEGIPEKAINPPTQKAKIDKNVYARRYLRLQGKFEKVLHSKIKKYIFNQRKKVLEILNSQKAVSDERKLKIMAELRALFDAMEDILISQVEPIYVEAGTQAGEMALENLGIRREFIVPQNILNTRLNMVKGMNETIYSSLKTDIFEGIKAGESIAEISTRVKDVYNTTTNRSRVIARTETASLMSGTTNDVYKSEGVTKKEWIATVDGETRDSHIQVDGEVRAMGQMFSNGLEYPGDPSGSPEEVINCRCALAPVVEG